MRAHGGLLALALLAACSSSEDERERVTLGDIELTPPAGWQAQALGESGRVWSPPTNTRKETIAVIIGPTFAGTPLRALERARLAQGALHDGRIVASRPLVTAAGLEGIRFDVKFRPDGVPGAVYDRSHCVLIDGDHTVHVLYTAASADASRAALDGVLGSIRKGS